MRCTEIILPLLSILFFAQANDIIFYNSKTGCDGSYTGCFKVPANTCCGGANVSASWVAIFKESAYDIAVMYSGGSCTTEACRAGAKGGFCCGPSNLSGGKWFPKARRKRSDDDDSDSQPTTGNDCVDVNVFGHAPDDYGAWEIRAEDVKDAFTSLHEEFESLASHEKTPWLQAQGAVYRVLPNGGPLPIIHPGGVEYDYTWT